MDKKKQGFFKKLKADFKNYDKHNTDMQKVFDANYFSAYRKTFVLKTQLKASFSFGFIGLSRKQQNENTLKHEYGHKLQLKQKGFFHYLFKIAIPSLTANMLDRKGKLPYDYFGSAWESEADKLGGVVRKTNNRAWKETEYRKYSDLLKCFKKK